MIKLWRQMLCALGWHDWWPIWHGYQCQRCGEKAVRIR